MLQVRQLTKRFGGLVAVDAVDFDVAQGEIFGLIGPNGAGKTTLFSLVAGALPPDAGEILFEGRSLAGMGSAGICGRGLARTFQIPQTFASMTVLESIMAGAMLHHRRIDAARAAASAVAQRVGLGRRLDVPTPALTTAEKKRLEVGRALATQPRMLLLDEVLAGLNSSEVGAMLELIRTLRGEGMTVLFVEHNMEAVMGICDRLVVMDTGRKIADGPPQEVMRDAAVVRAYLGDAATEVQHA
ncbi:ABC transporter ATP-binding protein [Comamonas endophytica]|uniref:ABC transporter ATP-binding protein n=1 Tax=Comamonas endophytica TaxID=2949090 RepID=A0ABY6GDD5_9BURK|nr:MULTISPECIES: ABC transporter ATP-binding protein [unclassified Acidovorax]MCD2512518.1 ABC transporter ATP-binding protein [Acidovorax sp. D4N7]UYG53116.1 ABC transporter ATP-binding protein [Acidovorax sp. 5MLIR]